MKKWIIPVTWQECGEVVVEAETLNEAIAVAKDADLPDGSYVFGSFELSIDDEDEIREWYNDGQEDDEVLA